MKWLASIAAVVVASIAPGAAAEAVPSPVRAELAPTGKLRVSLLPLPHIAIRNPEGQFSGVVVDLSRELAKRLDVSVEFTAAPSNLAAADQIREGQADLTFLVALPAVAAQIDFGPAYIGYETSVLVRADSPIMRLDDIDVPGLRIIVPDKGVSEARLRQMLRSAKLIGVPIAVGTAQRVIEMLSNGEADAYSNLTHLLSITQRSLPGWRVVQGSYMMTVFSIGYSKKITAGAKYANMFIEEMKANGFIQHAIERADLRGAAVPK
jgi:polar amino acid transport system substrate-binding protein